jgi:uncharacterized protein YbgA (DUF1722 family)/uncharacterized protein YbbK (DUF523 family)
MSRCIELDHCRWNGLVIASDAVKLLQPFVELAPVCPEADMGLGVPRPPVRIELCEGERRLVQPATGRDLTDEMRAYANAFLDELGAVDGVLLKSRSPSCGTKDVRIHTNGGKPPTGRVGIFAEVVAERLGHLPMEDEGRLTNHRLREHWLTRIFTLASFRAMRAQPSARALVEWHSRAKYLLMAHHEAAMRRMGRIVANHEHLPPEEMLDAYEAELHTALARPVRPGQVVNVLNHAMGFFSDKVLPQEKHYFLDCVEEYRQRRLPLSVPVALLRAWIVRFDEPYLREQIFFAPYPDALVQITDSGKGRDF